MRRVMMVMVVSAGVVGWSAAGQLTPVSEVLPAESRDKAVTFDHITADYAMRTIEGFAVHVHKDLTEGGAEAELGARALRILTAQLVSINEAVPAGALEQLHQVPIWISPHDNHQRFPCACYHPSREWLEENDYNPDKAGAVDILDARNFVKWTRDQPSMVLHELAHAYHHRVLGHGNAEIKAAYERAVAGRKYESVRHISGVTQRHYALNNDQEYFAEATEALFGTNDFYPFVRAELREHDPEAFNLLMRLWSRVGAEPAE